jgi:hypothetical protein
MTLSVKALTQNKRRNPAEQRCATSATIYNSAGQPIGQKSAFKMWRRTPHRIHTHLAKPVIHTHLSDTLTFEPQFTVLGQEINQELGDAVQISKDGNVVAVSSPNFDNGVLTDAGKVDVYKRAGTTWTLAHSLVGESANEFLGSEIALSGDGNVLVASNPLFNGDAGIVRTLIISSDVNYPALTGNAGDKIGSSLALNHDGSILVVGAIGIPQVQIFGNEFEQWVSLQYPRNASIISSDGPLGLGDFGTSVAIVGEFGIGTIIAVGATDPKGEQDPNNVGEVNVYQLTDNAPTPWVNIGVVVDPFTTISSKFGAFIALSDDASVLAISAPRATSNTGQTDAGYVYLTARDPTALPPFQYENGNQLGNIIYGDSANSLCGSSIRLRQNGALLAVGCFRDGNAALTNNGHGALYRLVNGVWTSQYGNIYGPLSQSSPAPLSDFDVDDSGTTVALGRGFFSDRLLQQGSLEILTLETELVKTSDYHKVVARDSLGCDADCWNLSKNSKNCYLNGSTQEYFKDTCANSKTLQKCGLPVARTGTAGKFLNIGSARNSGSVLPRASRAFILQPKCPLKSGLTLRGPNSVQTTQQLLQQQGIDYARGGRCNVPGRIVPIISGQRKTLSEMTTEDQERALDTKMKPPSFRLGAMPSSTYANHQRVMARRNGCANPRTGY